MRLDLYYERFSAAIKKKFLDSILSEKLINENKKYRTNGNNEVAALLEGNLNLVDSSYSISNLLIGFKALCIKLSQLSSVVDKSP